MDIYGGIKNFFVKLQDLPEKRKMVIFFTIISIAAIVIIFQTFISTKSDLSNILESLKPADLPRTGDDSANFPSNAPNKQIYPPDKDTGAKDFPPGRLEESLPAIENQEPGLAKPEPGL